MNNNMHTTLTELHVASDKLEEDLTKLKAILHDASEFLKSPDRLHLQEKLLDMQLSVHAFSYNLEGINNG